MTLSRIFRAVERYDIKLCILYGMHFAYVNSCIEVESHENIVDFMSTPKPYLGRRADGYSALKSF